MDNRPNCHTAVICRSVYSEAMSSNRRSRNVFLAIEKPIPAVTTTVASAPVALRSVLRSPFHSGTGARIGLFLLAGLLLILLHAEKPVQASVPLPAPESNGALAQVAESTGKLVLVPDDLYVGETTVALGFHLDFPDRAITIGYTEHFVPAGEECDSAEGGTVAFTATPARISLTACATGEGRVQLMETDTGSVIAEATAAITQPESASGDPRQGCIDPITFGPCLPDAPTGLEALVLGQRDIAVTWDRLIGATEYKVEKVEVRFGGSTETFDVTGTGKSFVVDAGTEHTFRVQAFGNGSTWAEEWGLWSTPVTVATEIPPTMSISVRSSSPSTITEGTSAQFTLRASHAPSFASLTINIDVTQEGDFLTFDPPPSTVRLSRNSTTASLSLSTIDDSTCEDDGSIRVTIEEQDSTSYYTYNVGSPSSATVPIVDEAEDCPPDPPARLGATADGGTAIDLEWNEQDGIANFWLQRRVGAAGTWTTVIDTVHGGATAYEDSEVTCATNRTYYYRLAAKGDGANYAAVWSAWSTVKSVPFPCENIPPDLSGPSSPTYAENGTEPVADYDATDPDGDNLTFSISGGDDSSRLRINETTGSLTFRRAPDFENPIDADEDNEYEVEVTVTDDGTPELSDRLDVTVVVTNRRPTITSGPSSRTYAEGGTGSVGSYVATDPGGGAISWSLSGTDQGDFDISTGGVLTFEDFPEL